MGPQGLTNLGGARCREREPRFRRITNLPRLQSIAELIFGQVCGRLTILFIWRHTFFLDGNGLNIVEPVQTGVESAKIVSFANNADDGLGSHEPEPTDIVAVLGVRH